MPSGHRSNEKFHRISQNYFGDVLKLNHGVALLKVSLRLSQNVLRRLATGRDITWPSADPSGYSYEEKIKARTSGSDYVIDAEQWDQKISKNKPFVANFFGGNFEQKILLFAEVDTNEVLKEIEDFAALATLAKTATDSNEALKKSGIFGLLAEPDSTVAAKNHTMLCRALECLNLEQGLSVSLNNIFAHLVSHHGSSLCKEKFMTQITDGSLHCRLAIFEDGPDLTKTATFAKNDNDTWTVSGIKHNVHAPTAENSAFLTLVKDEGSGRNSLFLVPYDANHVVVKREKGDFCTVEFSSASAFLIGNESYGLQLAISCLSTARLHCGAIAAGLAKGLVQNAVTHCLSTERYSRDLSDLEMTQLKLSEIAQDAFILESLTYFISLLYDRYEQRELDEESAVVKIVTTNSLSRLISNLRTILGPESASALRQVDDLAKAVDMFDRLYLDNDSLRLFIGQSGLALLGQQRDEYWQKRHFMQYPNVAWQRLKKRFYQLLPFPIHSQKFGFHEMLHPSVRSLGGELDKLMVRFTELVEMNVTYFGNAIEREQLVIGRLSDVAVDALTLFACASRASRSKSIGLRNADLEVALVHSVFCSLRGQIERNLRDLELSTAANGDEDRLKVARALLKANAYPLTHPLTRNW